jgi:hypothetical protein
MAESKKARNKALVIRSTASVQQPDGWESIEEIETKGETTNGENERRADAEGGSCLRFRACGRPS